METGKDFAQAFKQNAIHVPPVDPNIFFTFLRDTEEAGVIDGKKVLKWMGDHNIFQDGEINLPNAANYAGKASL